jgi:flagellar basal body-associated protein FliL
VEKNKLMLIIIIVLLLVLLGTIVGVAIYTFTAVKPAETTEVGDLPQGAGHLPPDKITTFKIEDPFKTNLLKGEDGSEHVISVLISFAISNVDAGQNKELTETLTNSSELTKSKILKVIRDKTYEDLSQGGDSQDMLAGEILTVLQETFETNLIVDVFVSEMYVY